MFLGIDLGTSAVKAVLVDENQHSTGFAMVTLTQLSQKPDWSEGDPDLWWEAVETAILTLKRKFPTETAGVQAIGLAGHMHACLLLDRQDRPVRPAILWNDGRATAEAGELFSRNPTLANSLGMRPVAGFAGSHIAWLNKYEPEVLERVETLLLPKDEIRRRMTGEKATDPSDAAGTWLFDEKSRSWSHEAVALCGANSTWLPPVIESNATAGYLLSHVAKKWGMKAGIPVACGGGDTPVGGIGIGAVERGDGFVSLGTSAQIFLADDRFAPAPDHMVHAFCHAVPGRWYEMAAHLNGASALAAARTWVGAEDLESILDSVQAQMRGPSTLLALPYLTGERTPHNNPHARGVIFGLTSVSSPKDIVQAMLEAVAFSLADGLAAIRTARDIPDELAFIGGGSRSSLWGTIIANVLGIRLIRFQDASRGPAFGAARLARMALTKESFKSVATKPPVDHVFEPDPAMTARYLPCLSAFRDLYRALEPQFESAPC